MNKHTQFGKLAKRPIPQKSGKATIFTEDDIGTLTVAAPKTPVKASIPHFNLNVGRAEKGTRDSQFLSNPNEYPTKSASRRGKAGEFRNQSKEIQREPLGDDSFESVSQTPDLGVVQMPSLGKTDSSDIVQMRYSGAVNEPGDNRLHYPGFDMPNLAQELVSASDTMSLASFLDPIEAELSWAESQIAQTRLDPTDWESVCLCRIIDGIHNPWTRRLAKYLSGQGVTVSQFQALANRAGLPRRVVTVVCRELDLMISRD